MTNLQILLDSSVLQEYKRRSEHVKRFVHRIIDGDISAGVSALSVVSLWSDQNFDRKTEIGFSTILKFMEVIPLDASVAKSMPANVSLMDTSLTFIEISAVACTAKVYECPIVCEKTESYDGFDVEIYDCESYLLNLATNL